MKTIITTLMLAAGLAAPVPLRAAAAKSFELKNGKSTSGEAREFVYKKTPQGELSLFVHNPPGWKNSDKRPAIIFFFGGGWRNGSPTQFLAQAEYFATRGLVTLRADYRVLSRQHTTPDKCVEDAKSAMRWLRGRAEELGVDPHKVIASGGSAGGHLAAAVAMVEGFDAPDDNLNISCVPNAMVLFNPALNLARVSESKNSNVITNAAGEDIGRKISPTFFMKQGAPPAVIFFGTTDTLLAHGREYLARAKELGNHAEMYTAEGMAHGFFNKSPWSEVTAQQADVFLASLGYLKGEPTLKIPPDSKAVLKQE